MCKIRAQHMFLIISFTFQASLSPYSRHVLSALPVYSFCSSHSRASLPLCFHVVTFGHGVTIVCNSIHAVLWLLKSNKFFKNSFKSLLLHNHSWLYLEIGLLGVTSSQQYGTIVSSHHFGILWYLLAFMVYILFFWQSCNNPAEPTSVLHSA